jgi:hypothetical protein
LEVQGLPSGMVLQPHGIFYARQSRTMYAVSHGFRKGGSNVQIFTVSDPGGDAPPSLIYARSAPFENGVINDVVGISPTEFYVTRWLAMPLPVGGKHNPDTPEQRTALQTQALKELFGFSHECVVYHCEWKEWTTRPVSSLPSFLFVLPSIRRFLGPFLLPFLPSFLLFPSFLPSPKFPSFLPSFRPNRYHDTATCKTAVEGFTSANGFPSFPSFLSVRRSLLSLTSIHYSFNYFFLPACLPAFLPSFLPSFLL